MVRGGKRPFHRMESWVPFRDCGFSGVVQRRGMAKTDWFVEARFGMFLHWGTYAVAGRHEWVKKHEDLDDAHYLRYFERFDPDLYDPRDWAARAAAAGMKYAVITAKHHEGFCLWDTAHTDYKATNCPAGRDLLAEWVKAFREAGLRIGLYYSLIDWNHPDFTTDKHYPRSGKMTREERAARDAGRDMKRYAAYMRAQVEELLVRFGKIDIIWYDFSYPGADGKGRADWESEKLHELTRRLQPDILIDNRLDLPGSGDFVTPEQVQVAAAPKGPKGEPVVWEACQTFSGSWGYHRDEQTWKTVKQLLWMLIDGVSKGGNLLLNVGPTARGEFDHRAKERLEGMGAWMRRHGRSIHGCGAAPAEFIAPADGRFTWDARRRLLYLHLFHWPFGEMLLEGLAGKVRFARFLHDGSEVELRGAGDLHAGHGEGVAIPSDAILLKLPVVAPAVEVPVIELALGG